jgi:predicted ATP-grasp superfamily ATP-dependent carboligase
MLAASQATGAPLACAVTELSMVRALGRRQIPVALATSEPRSPMTRSRYCREIIPLPPWWSEPERAVDALIDWTATKNHRPVLFYDGDHDLIAISRARQRLAPHFRFVLPPAELVEACTDKLRFAELAEQRALPVPRTALLTSGTDFDDFLAGWSSFPAVLKPAMRNNWFATVGSHEKALRIETREQLRKSLDDLGTHGLDLVLQAAVEGGEEQIVSYHAYVRADGSTAAEFTGRKIRTWPRRYGLSTYLQITDDADVLRAGRSLVDTLEFTGVLKADFKIDVRDQQLYLLEVNPRFNLWHHAATVAGAPIPEMVYRDCVDGLPARRGATVRARAGLRWINPVADLPALREYRAAGEVTLPQWARQVLTAQVNEGFNWRDPLPGLVALGHRLQRRFKRLIDRSA